MKRTFTLLFTLLLFNVILLQAQTEKGGYAWIEANPLGETLNLEGIAVDDDLNIYLTGTLIADDGFQRYDTLSFFDTLFQFPQRNRQGFVAKLDSSRNILWFRLMNTNNFSTGHGITLGKDGNIYATGIFNDTLRLGGDSLIAAPNSVSRYVVSYAPNGALRWSNQYTNNAGNADEAPNLKADQSGTLYLSATFRNTVVFPDINKTLTAYIPHSVVPNNKVGSFYARITPSGAWQWAESIPTVSSSYAMCIDDANKLWIGNFFIDSLKFQDTLCQVEGKSDPFLARLEDDGSLMLFKHYTAKGNRDVRIGAMHSGVDGMIFLTGVMDKTFAFGAINPNDSFPPQSNNGFLAALDTSGQEIWFEPLISCCINLFQLDGDENNTLYASGIFSERLDIQGERTQIDNTVHGIILKFDSSGKYFWNHHVQGNTLNYHRGMAYGDGGVYSIGFSRLGNPNTHVRIYVGEDTLISIYRDMRYLYRIQGDSGNPTSLFTPTSPDFVLYPNPATKYFQIESDQSPITGISLFDQNGRELIRWDEQNERYELPELSPGLYMLSIEIGSQRETRILQILPGK